MTEPARPAADAGFRPWHFYVLLSMVGATVAVVVADNTHPAALLLLSAAVVSAGLTGLAFHRALAGFLGRADEWHGPLGEAARAALEREKALTLRSIKELEFDRAMGKVSERDFDDLVARLRARALAIMDELDNAPATPVPAVDRGAAPAGTCAGCGAAYDSDARFCKQCGARL